MLNSRIFFAFAPAVLTFVALVASPFASATEIPNFRAIAPGIFAGANPIDGEAGTDAFYELVDLKIKVDIDLQGSDVTEAPNLWTRLYNQLHEKGEQPEMIETERRLAVDAQMMFQNLPINSNNEVSGDEILRINAALDLMTHATVQNPIYIHCEHGADRTGLIVALYRVLYQGVSIDQANEEWTRFGHTDKARLFTRNLDRYFCLRVANKSSSQFCADLD